jgi:hypothetical protein
MSDTKISALTSATTPLAGTEVLPIVQSSTTVKVAVNDLTVRNIRAAATTGILQVSGPTAGTTRTVTVPDANYTVARTDAAQSFTGDQTLSTGNLIQGTAAKGFNFTANTPAAGKTSQLLNWYEEGNFDVAVTMGSGTCTLDSTYNKMKYTRIGRMVSIQGQIKVASVSSPSGAMSMTLPFTSAAADEGSSLSGATPRLYGVTKPILGIYPFVFVNSGSSFMELEWVVSGGATIPHIPAANEYYIIAFSYTV